MVCKTNVGGKKVLEPTTFIVKQADNNYGFENRQYECGFRPKIVTIKATKSNHTGINMTTYGKVDSTIYPQLTSSYPDTFGTGPFIGITSNTGSSGTASTSITEINNTGFKLSIANSANHWNTSYVVELEITAYP